MSGSGLDLSTHDELDTKCNLQSKTTLDKMRVPLLCQDFKAVRTPGSLTSSFTHILQGCLAVKINLIYF